MKNKYEPPYESDMERIMYVIREGLPFEDAGVNNSAKNIMFYKKLKKEVQQIRDSGKEVVWPN